MIGVPARIAGNTKIGSARSPAIPRSENAVRPPTAVVVSLPAVANMRNCVAAALTAAPPGTMRLMALPASCEVATEIPYVLVSQGGCAAAIDSRRK